MAPGPSSEMERASRLVAALEALEAEGGDAPPGEPIRLFRAPGRVNLIGEHTDYNDGFALPAAIDREVWMAARGWDRPEVDATSLDLGERRVASLEGLGPGAAAASWIDYLAGVAWAASAAGHPVRGFRAVIDSTLPIGAGLSSSAAVEMVAALALLDGTDLGPIDRARLGRTCENDFVGVPTGVMDQLASAAGRSGRALLLDCRSLELVEVALPRRLTIVICHTGAPRALKGSEYAARRADCERGVELIAQREPGVKALRDVDRAMLERHRDRLPERVYRRCRHVVGEDARVLEAVAAFRDGDLETIGRLFAASHDSLRDDYEVVSPELDALVEIARETRGVVAARMTGGGFGGCTVNLVETDAVGRLAATVERRYPKLTGLRPRVFATTAVDGAGPIEW